MKSNKSTQMIGKKKIAPIEKVRMKTLFAEERDDGIVARFLELTKYTFPYGTEEDLLNYLRLYCDLTPDGFGNYYFKIGESKTMFTSHLDTACSNQVMVQHRFSEHFIGTDGKSILGADDKAGVTIMLELILNEVPGLYYFFIGEECGGIGSRDAAFHLGGIDFQSYSRCVSFDRRGYHSVITHQSYSRCCSDDFASALCDELARQNIFMAPDDSGLFTDSKNFIDLIPECTNISVGYFNEHTKGETQNATFLKALCKALPKVKWESLPTIRDCDDDKRIPSYKNYSRDYSEVFQTKELTVEDDIDAYVEEELGPFFLEDQLAMWSTEVTLFLEERLELNDLNTYIVARETFRSEGDSTELSKWFDSLSYKDELGELILGEYDYADISKYRNKHRRNKNDFNSIEF